MIRLCAVALVLGALAGCTSHTAPYKPKLREYSPGHYPKAARATHGSLFAEAAAQGLVEDDRARRIGDVVIIRVDESNSASHDDSTKLNHQASQDFGILGALQKAAPAGVDLSKLLGTKTDSVLDSGGTISRRGSLQATLPVRVRDVMPNGDLFVEGTKVTMVGEEEHHLYLSGLVRQVDIFADGSVLSSRVADAEIEYTGRGDASDQQRHGWLSRLLTKIWPF